MTIEPAELLDQFRMAERLAVEHSETVHEHTFDYAPGTRSTTACRRWLPAP